jgi:RNA:NAD 2'-phosphotransferase (TPT1/KptA family)
VDPRQLVRTSKYLSLHLRHRPARWGLELGPGGWVEVDRLLAAAARDGHPLTSAELDEVVARNDKQRFSFDASGTRIWANQGHSVEVDLQALVRSLANPFAEVTRCTGLCDSREPCPVRQRLVPPLRQHHDRPRTRRAWLGK